MGEPNPHHEIPSGLKFDIARSGRERTPYFNVGYSIDATAAVATLELINTSGSTAIRVRFTDNKNKSASHVFKSKPTGETFALDTSELDANSPWIMLVYGFERGDVSGENATDENYTQDIAAPRSASGDTVPSGLQALYPWIEDNASTSPAFTEEYIPHGSTVALGEYSAGEDLLIQIAGYGNVAATDGLPAGFVATNLAITGDVVSFVNATPVTASGGTGGTILAENIALNIVGVGSFSAVFTIYSEDNGYPVYSWTFTWTVV